MITERQIKQAKILDEVVTSNSKLVLLDMRNIDIVNVFPRFAVYELKGDTHFFVAGSNDRGSAYDVFAKEKSKHIINRQNK